MKQSSSIHYIVTIHTTPSLSVSTKLFYGRHLDEQNEISSKIIETIGKVECISKHILQIFQKHNYIKSIYNGFYFKTNPYQTNHYK